jgi:hypothetical protein
MYSEYHNGFLPNRGGYLDQPMKLSQVITIMDALIKKLEQDNGE